MIIKESNQGVWILFQYFWRAHTSQKGNKTKQKNQFNCINMLNDLSKTCFDSKKAHQKRKLLGTNKTILTLREFYPTANTLLSTSREGSAIMYHAQGCCKATCKAPGCVPGELPAATASAHFKASDQWASESFSYCKHTPATPLHQAAQQSKTSLTWIYVWLSLLLNAGIFRCLYSSLPQLRDKVGAAANAVRQICSPKRK